MNSDAPVPEPPTPKRRGNRRVDATPPTPQPVTPATTPPPQPHPTELESSAAPEVVAAPRRARFPWKPALGGLALAGALAASWALLPVRQVKVTGNRQLTSAEVQRLAGLHGSFGWLYYGAWKARGLLGSPWVAAAQVTKHFPDRVDIQVTERVPVARWQDVGGQVRSLAADGTLLPGAAPGALPLISGWGPERRAEAVRVLAGLSGYNVKSVNYTPSGLRVELAAGSVWSGDPESLLKYAGSLSMYPNRHINIYPWGVSVQE